MSEHDAKRRTGNPNWKPGVSGNPRGRPKTGYALAEMIRDVAGQPDVMREFVGLVFDIAFGRGVCIDADYQRACAEARRAGLAMPARPANGEMIQPSLGEMQRAQDWLAQWGFQKPVQELEINGAGAAPSYDYSKLSPTELDMLEATLRKAAGVDPAPGPARLPAAIIDASAVEKKL